MKATSFLKAPSKTEQNETHDGNLPWVEKYRPRKIDDVSFQDEVVRALKKAIDTGNLPHLLFYGPPGTGKTSTILAIARELYGPTLYKDRTLELNASNERGINVIRTTVKNFAQLSAKSEAIGQGRNCPSYKLIILDEADSMTPEAQAALRRTMETFSKVTRFCLICNYISRIIDPLASRCAKFRFRPLEKGTVLARLKHICEQESVKVDEPALDCVIGIADGDLRKAITLIQSVHRLSLADTIEADAVIEIAGVIPESLLDRVFKACQSNSFDSLQTITKEIVASGYHVGQVVYQMHERVVQMDTLTDLQKAKISQQLALTDYYLTEGSDEFLQLLQVVSFVMKTIC